MFFWYAAKTHISNIFSNVNSISFLMTRHLNDEKMPSIIPEATLLSVFSTLTLTSAIINWKGNNQDGRKKIDSISRTKK
jgi:hypothetical protein